MAKAIEHGIRNPKEEPKSDKKEKVVAYGVRNVSDSFDRRPSESNTPPSNDTYKASGEKFGAKEPSFKKFR